MTPSTFSLIAGGLYLLSAYLIYANLRTSAIDRWKQLLPAIGATIAQIFVLNTLINKASGLDLGILNAFCLIGWLISIQIILSSFFKRIESLGIVIFPITALSLIVAAYSEPGVVVQIGGNSLKVHIMTSVIAYSLITLASCHALLLAYQDKAIKTHNPGGFVRILPPIHDMETLLFQFLGFGFVFLSVSLISGFYFLDDLFAQRVVHKTVLSILAWLILGTLIFGRLKFGWRGKTAIRWTLSSFAFLLLAFFGSKLVIEIILSTSS